MKIPCIKHKWIYFDCDKTITHSGIKNNKVYVGVGHNTKTRICSKCRKKQRWVSAVTSDFPSSWYDDKLTLNDERHFKILDVLS